MLTVLDEYTRECRVIHVDRHINAEMVRGIMQKLINWYDRHNISIATMDRFRGVKQRHTKPFIESELQS